MPVTIETTGQIKEARDEQPPGSFLSELGDRVKSLNIQAEEKRRRRHKGDGDIDPLTPFLDPFSHSDTEILSVSSYKLEKQEMRKCAVTCF